MSIHDDNMHQASRPAGRRDRRLRYKHLAFGVGLALGSLLVCGVALAASGASATESPTGGKVIGGAGSITQNGAETIVKQQSKLLALDWQTFNVGKDASVRFDQPSLNAVALNRILDQNPSQIFGKINSNGQIFLINTHGIIFGSSAQLNVGGLVASTLDLTPDDFLQQHFSLDAHGGHAGIVNHGTIAAARGGSVTLIGGNVQNSGLIVADYGRINLDGADKAVLDFDGNGLINVQITGALQKRFDSEQSAVANKGTLKATSGNVVLQASAAKDLFTNLVNNSGVIDAHGISTDGGVVRLVGNGGNAVSSGRIDASGVHGGNIQVLSDKDVLLTSGTLDASGTHGGGEVLVGGDAHGANPLVPNAEHAEVDSGVSIDASAGQTGDGGKVVVWSDHGTRYHGHIASRGGDVAGNGGFVEVSGKDFLLFKGTADRLAPHGAAGTLLLDPTNLTISQSGTTTAPCVSGVCESDSKNSVLNTTDLETALAGGPVNVDATAGTGNGSGSINWTDGSVDAGGNSLTLTATSITFDGTLTNLADLVFAGTSLSGTGSAAGTGSITGLGSNAFGLTGTKAGKAAGITFSGFGAADTTTVTGASGFDYTTKTSRGMTFADATTVAGSGAITGLGSSAFDLTGNQAGSAGSISFSGFAAADTTTVTGASDFDYATRVSEGMTFADATSVTGTGGITGLGSTAFNLSGNQAGTAGSIGFSGFGAADTTTVTGASAFDIGSKSADGMTFANVTSVSGTGLAATITGTGQTYTLDASTANKGSGNGITWTSFGNIDDAAGTVVFGSASSLGGSVTAVTLDYSGYGSAVNFDLGGTATGIGGSWSGVTSVTGSGNADTITGLGSNAFNLTGTRAGTADGIGFSAFESADTTTVTGAAGFDYTTKVSRGMAFADATNVAGTGAITGLGGTAFNLIGNKAGSAGSIGFSGFTAADTTTVAGASGFDDASKSSEGMAFDNATAVTGSGAIANVNGSFADGTGKSSASGITYTGFDTVSGSGGDVTGVTGNFDIGTKVSSASGLDYSGFNVTTVSGSGAGATITGTGQTYTLDASTANKGSGNGLTWTSFGKIADGGTGTINTTGGQSYTLTGANAGTVSTLLPGGFTGIGTINDAAGTIHFGANGSLSGDVVVATLDYGSYASAVGFDLSATGGATTGIGGTWSGVTSVIGSGNTDTVKGSNQSYALTGAGNGNNGAALTWTSFERIADSGSGTISTTGGQSYTLTGADTGTVATLLPGGFTGIGSINDAAGTIHFGTNGSLSGDVTAAMLDYGSYGSAVSFDLSAAAGTTTGIGGSWSGVTAVIGSGHADTVAGSGQTYSLTGSATGNNGAVGWTSFENIADNGSGTITATNQNWALTGAGQGTVAILAGSFTGIGSLVDTGTGHFTMHAGADGSLSGGLDAGTGGTIDYTGYTTPVNVNLAGTGSTGIAGNLAGISTILADSNLGVAGAAGGSLAIANSGAGSTTKLGALTVGNGLTVNANGAVLQGSGPLVVVGATSILAGGHAVTLGNVSNDFGGGVTVEGAGVTLTDANDLNIASLTNSGNGDVSLIAGGALFGVGAIDAGTGNITLAANGGALNTATLTGGDITLTGAGGIVLGSNVTAAGDLSLTSGSTISQNLGTVITADSLTGSSAGSTILEGNNKIGSLGDFTAAGFSLTSGQALTVAAGATVDGGASTTLTTAGASHDLAIDGTVRGTTTELVSSGAIAEGNGGVIDASVLTGSSAGDTTLGGANQIDTLAQFGADDFTLVNAAALTVQGPLVTTGDISLTTTGPGNVLSVGQALTGGMISLASAGDLSIVQAIQGTTINLTANGNLAISAAIDSGSGVTTLIQNGASGTISQSGAGTITAGTLTGAAQGSVALIGANAIANLGDFAAEGFSLTNAGALTVAAGSTVDGGDSTMLKTGGDLTIDGNVAGTLTSLVSSGAITEGSAGTITAGILTGSAAHAAQLTGHNTIDNIGNFKANGLSLTNGQALTVLAGATVDGGANTALTVTGSGGNLAIDGTLKGTNIKLVASGSIGEGAQGSLQAGTLTGSSTGSTTLTGANNAVANLGNFTANGFSLTSDQTLTVAAGSTVDGKASTTLTTAGAGHDIGIDGTVKGGLVTLVSSGAIGQGADGRVQADGLTGSSVGDTKLTQTGIDALNAFNAKNFSLTNTKALAVGGPVTTTGNAGDISLATSSGHALTVNQAVKGAAIMLDSGGDLTVANAVTGTAVNLSANGNLLIDAAVDSGAGTTTLAQTGTGTITSGANGSITAATLTGSATGATTLGSAGRFMGNHVGVLGGFSSKGGFSFTNDGTLTLASVNGSAFTVDAGQSDLYLAVHNGDLLQTGTTTAYDGVGTWSASGHIGLANAPIYVTGASPQIVAAIGSPPAYFYAVDYNGNLLPLTGATSVNVPTSILSSRSQGVNGHSDRYIDVGVITATYRAYGVVPPGLLLPPDQQQCSPDQPSPECVDAN